jgi:hypothetical protein
MSPPKSAGQFPSVVAGSTQSPTHSEPLRRMARALERRAHPLDRVATRTGHPRGPAARGGRVVLEPHGSECRQALDAGSDGARVAKGVRPGGSRRTAPRGYAPQHPHGTRRRATRADAPGVQPSSRSPLPESLREAATDARDHRGGYRGALGPTLDPRPISTRKTPFKINHLWRGGRDSNPLDSVASPRISSVSGGIRCVCRVCAADPTDWASARDRRLSRPAPDPPVHRAVGFEAWRAPAGCATCSSATQAGTRATDSGDPDGGGRVSGRDRAERLGQDHPAPPGGRHRGP